MSFNRRFSYGYVEDVPSDNGVQSIIRDEQHHVVFPTFVPPRIEVTPPTRRRATSVGGPSISGTPATAAEIERTDSRPRLIPGRFPWMRSSPNTATQQRQSFDTLGSWRDSHDFSGPDQNASDQPASDQSGPERQGRRRDGFMRFNIGQDHCQSRCHVDENDGRLRVSLRESGAGGLARLMGVVTESASRLGRSDETEVESDGQQRSPEELAKAARVPKPPRLSEASTATVTAAPPPRVPRMNIVIMVIGSRGDVQPFLRIGQVLKQKHGHRVRVATHPDFREITQDEYGLEHFSVGGDPAQLMAFMVKNPGMIPTLETVKAGEIGRKRTSMAEMFEGFWRACVCATDDPKDAFNAKELAKRDEMPFVADAIIANPPSYAHVHCAEALSIPLHIMFTFPYTPTQAFPHPLVSINKSNIEPGTTNLMSYPLVDIMVWQGLGDLVNELRTKTLVLDPVSAFWAPGALARLKLPYTYIWSPGLVPKPADWGPSIDIAGFVFATNGSSYTAEDSLVKFLEASDEPPIYIGFGSIVVDDPEQFTSMIFEAVSKAGVRALVSKGWGKLGSDKVPDNVYMLGNIPHDWLFPRVRAAVIHGGAGTTAIALKCGLPTMVVPFFGDQIFWGNMIAQAKAGPPAVPYKQLTTDKLADGIKYLLTDEAKAAVEGLAECIAQDGDGAENAVDLFHNHLDIKLDRLRCCVLEGRTAAWATRWGHVPFSPLAAAILVKNKKMTWKRLHLMQHHEFRDFYGPGEPITGVIAAVAEGLGRIFFHMVSVPINLAKTANKNRAMQREHQTSSNMDDNSAKKRKKKEAAAGGDSERKDSKMQDAERNPEAQLGNSSHAEMLPATCNCCGDLENADPRTRTRCAIHQNLVDEPVPEDPLGPPGFSVPEDEYVRAVFNGIGYSALILVLMPVFIGNAIAQGFHNAPHLYGDTTVRAQPKVTGFHSGLRATRFEMVYGVYDAFTGVVTQPYCGAKTAGTAGFVKGVGYGLAGLVLKNLAAVTAPVYALKGALQQVRRNQQPKAWVRRARIVQGVRELESLPAKERAETEARVLRDWAVMSELFTVITKTQRESGLRGFLSRKKAAQDIGYVLDTVESAQWALESLKNGDSLDHVLAVAGGCSLGMCWKTSYFRAKKKAEQDGDVAGGWKNRTETAA